MVTLQQSIESTQHRGFIPTGETVCFVIAGRDIRKRVELLSKFREEHFFRRYNILSLYHSGVPETFWSGKLSISDEYLTYLTTGETYDPVYSLTFPASKLTTAPTIRIRNPIAVLLTAT